MKLTLLGSCSGTEPMPERKHTSFVVEHGGGLYWFDAGEGCARTAHLAGLDVRQVRAIFVSHCHLDHTGGLANLVWTMAKLEGRSEEAILAGQTIPMFIPRPEVWEAAGRIVGSGDPFKGAFQVDASAYGDGIVFDRDGLRVTALHNRHMGEPAEGEPWRSFSLRIDTEAGAILFSGDVKDVSEIAPLLDGADIFMMETGHHRVEDVCAWLAERDSWTGRLVFVHHGRAILYDPATELAKARDILGDRVAIGADGMVLTP